MTGMVGKILQALLAPLIAVIVAVIVTSLVLVFAGASAGDFAPGGRG